MIRKTAPLLLIACLVPSYALSQGAVQWGSSDKAYRQPVEGMKGYFEPEKVKRDGGVVSFTVFRSADPAVADEIGSYMVNCETKEYATVAKGQASRPEKLLPGEQLFAVSSKLCEWSERGFLKNFW